MKINLIKGILTLVLTGLIITACSKDDEPENNVAEPENNVAKDLCYIFDSSTKTATVTYSTEVEPQQIGENYPGLTAISIPSTIEHNDTIYTVTSIGDQAFLYCSGLTSITIPNSVTSIGDDAFSYCSGLTSITIPNTVTSIGDDAFSHCSGLTSITIPNSVTSIGGYAFLGCKGLTNVTIGNSVSSIGLLAFGTCRSLNNFIVDENNPYYSSIDGVIYEKDLKTLVLYPSGREGSFEIPNTVTSIGDFAFEGCEGLKSVTIPNSVTSIGLMAFYYCHGLTSITIPNSVNSIGDFAFYDCRKLTSITIGNSVISIGYEAFAYCPILETIYCKPLTPPQAYPSDFTSPNGSYLANLYVPLESVSLYKSTEPWSNFKNIVGVDTFPEE